MDDLHKMIFLAALFGCVLIAGLGMTLSRASPVLADTARADTANADPARVDAAQAAPTQAAQSSTKQNDSGGDCLLSSRYPDSIRRWCSLIQKYADQSELETNLIAAVMLQESGGNPDAYSRSGAVGLLQVMPRDGIAASFQCVNGPCFASRPTIDELKDPETNIAYGVRMLAGLIKRAGDLRAGLKSYGPDGAGYTYADKVLAIFRNY